MRVRMIVIRIVYVFALVTIESVILLCYDC